MLEGGEGGGGAGGGEEQVQVLLLEAGALDAALEEEEMGPRVGDGSRLAAWWEGSQGWQGPQPVAGGLKVLSCHLAEKLGSRHWQCGQRWGRSEGRVTW